MDEIEINEAIEKLRKMDGQAEAIDDEISQLIRSGDVMRELSNRLHSTNPSVRADAQHLLAQIQMVYARPNYLTGQLDKWLANRATSRRNLLATSDVQSIIAKLRDSAPTIRKAAAEELGELGDLASVRPLIDALDDPSEFVREYVIEALRKIAEENEIPELEPYLKSDDVHKRIAAAYALGAKGGKDAVRGLVDLVRIGITGSKPEYERARKELQLIGQSAVDELIEVLNERDEVLSQLAVEVLVPIGDMRALPHIVAAMGDEDDQVYEVATWGASEFGEAAIPLLMDALKSSNARLRAKSAEAMVKIPFLDITQLMVNLLQDTDAEVRRVALFALGNIGDRTVVEHIIPLLRGPAQDEKVNRTTASYAAQVLKVNLPTPESLEAVVRWKREEAGKGI